MNQLLFPLAGNEQLADSLSKLKGIEKGSITFRHFPDGESYIKINSNVAGKHAIIICTLNDPDTKILQLYFIAKTLKELGALKVTLIAPYLAYMRQDMRFTEGEVVSSVYFSKLISSCCDNIITIDPHLHRYKSLNEIYTIPAVALHAAPVIARWIHENIERPVLAGPDVESMQWVQEVAHYAQAPFFVLQKKRKSDTDVEISVPHIAKYSAHTPVLIDDIISTGSTMVATILHLKNAGMQPPVCIGVHGLFANDAYDKLLHAGAGRIITCNTVAHASNAIEISGLISTVI